MIGTHAHTTHRRKYDTSRTLAQNVTLTDPILQRFDILCVCVDTVDPVMDERLATFVTRSHMESHSASSAEGRRAASSEAFGGPSVRVDVGRTEGRGRGVTRESESVRE